jgi:hypothetical protein
MKAMEALIFQVVTVLFDSSETTRTYFLSQEAIQPLLDNLSRGQISISPLTVSTDSPEYAIAVSNH